MYPCECMLNSAQLTGADLGNLEGGGQNFPKVNSGAMLSEAQRAEVVRPGVLGPLKAPRSQQILDGLRCILSNLLTVLFLQIKTLTLFEFLED